MDRFMLGAYLVLGLVAVIGGLVGSGFVYGFVDNLRSDKDD